AAVGLLEVRLALDAALGGGVGAQALEADVLAAVAAGPIAAVLHARARGLQRAQLGEVARGVGLVEVLDQALHRLVAGVGDRADHVVQAIFAQPVQVAAHFAGERRAAVFDEGLQLPGLLGCERHGNAAARTMPVQPPKRARGLNFDARRRPSNSSFSGSVRGLGTSMLSTA